MKILVSNKNEKRILKEMLNLFDTWPDFMDFLYMNEEMNSVFSDLIKKKKIDVDDDINEVIEDIAYQLLKAEIVVKQVGDNK